MDIVELKAKIEQNTLDNQLLVLKYADCKYLCNQYIDKIAQNKKLQKVNINNLDDISNDDFFDTSDTLYVLDIDKLNYDVDSTLKNVVIICNQITADLSVDYTEIPKLQPWQIVDYIKMRLPGLDDTQVNWLCEVCNYDVYRLNKECSKIEIFNEKLHKIIFSELNQDGAYGDLNNLTIFNFTNAILKKDYNVLKTILADLINIDIEGTGVVTLMLRNIKNLIDIQINPKNTAESLGMSPKQYNAVKWNKNKFTNTQLINMYEFLTDVDYRIKNGDLSLKDNSDHLTVNNMLVDYLTINLLNLGTAK